LKIIFVNKYFYPDHSATSQLLTDLSFALADQGYKVHILTSRQIYDDPSAKLPAIEESNGVNIYRMWTTQFGRSPLIGRAIDYITFYICCAWRLFWLISRDDIVVAKTDPPMLSEVVTFIARMRKAIVVNWLQDLFPEAAWALKIKALEGLFGRFLFLVRNISLKYAYVNVVIGRIMSKKLTMLGINPNQIKIIHNWSDGDLIKLINPKNNSLRKQWGLSGKFVVGYSGNMGRDHEFKTLLDSAETLAKYNNIVFLFIGGGIKRKWIEAEVVKRGLKNCIFKPYQPRSSLGESITLPDVHIISFQPELEGYAVPSKFYGVAAACRPTIFVGDSNGEIARIIKKEKCGFNIRIGDYHKFVHCLIKLYKSSDLRERMGMNARRSFDRLFSKKVAISKWVELISEISKHPMSRR